MDHDQSIRDNLARLLTHSKQSQRLTYSEIIHQTGLGMQIVDNAISYGIADAVDLVRICRALDLDATEVIAEAINHVGGTIADITGEDLLSHEDDHPAATLPGSQVSAPAPSASARSNS